MTEPTARRQRRSLALGTRIFLATALLVILAVGSSVIVTWTLGNRVGQTAAHESLVRASTVQQTFQERQLELLGSIALQLAGDPAFSAYIAEAVAAGDVLSLLDQLDSRREAIGFDFAVLLDPDGIVVARTDDPEATGQDLSADPLYTLAFEGYDATGIWAQDGGLYSAVGVPVTAGSLLQGFLIAAYAIDDSAALELRDINSTEVVYFITQGAAQPVASTLSPSDLDDLRTLFAEDATMQQAASGDVQDQYQVSLGGRPWLAVVRPLLDVTGEQVGMVVNLASLYVQLAPFRLIGRILLAVGVIAILLALVVSYILPKRVLQPMLRLTGAANAAAEGDYDQPIGVDRDDEVGQLANAFRSLLSELREKRDMEIYVNELARSVPDAEAATTEAAPPSKREIALLGVEMRRYSQQLDPQVDPGQTLDLLTRSLRRITRAITAQGGKVECILGHRLLASFEGARRSDRALGAAAEIAESTRNAHGHSAALAIATGVTVSGTVSFDQRPDYAVTGSTVDQLETLLRIAQDEGLVIAQSTQAELATTFEQTGIRAQGQRSSIISEPIYALDGTSLGRFAVADQMVTQQMTHTLGASGTSGATATHISPITLSGIGIGSVLGGRFEILSELGAGGMGVVYKARDRSLDELVALKMLKGDVWGDRDRLERLKEELKLARKIAHPNILRTFDFGEADGRPFISMEFVRGITLRQLLDRSGRLPLSAGLRSARQLCRGLLAAHHEGILHRDIKPENLIIEHTGNLKLMDFGIARPIERRRPAQTEPGAIIGTPFYLSPEQLEGLEADERADIYACGVVIYEIFTGSLPFSTEGNIFEIITRKLQEPPVPPRTYWPNMPEPLERIILQCLTRNLENRYASVEVLLEDLEVMRG